MLSHFSRVWLLVTLWTIVPRLLCPWDSPGKNTGVGCHASSRGSSWPRGWTWVPIQNKKLKRKKRVTFDGQRWPQPHTLTILWTGTFEVSAVSWHIWKLILWQNCWQLALIFLLYLGYWLILVRQTHTICKVDVIARNNYQSPFNKIPF